MLERGASFAEQRYDLAVVELASGKVTIVTAGDAGPAEPTWSPDGRWLAFSRGGAEMATPGVAADAEGRLATVWAYAPGDGETRLLATAGGMRQVAWAPGGEMLTYVAPGVASGICTLSGKPNLWSAEATPPAATPLSAFFVP